MTIANPIIHTYAMYIVRRYVFPINTHSKKLNFPVHRIKRTIVCCSEKNTFEAKTYGILPVRMLLKEKYNSIECQRIQV